MVVPDLYIDCHKPVYKEIFKKNPHFYGFRGTDKLSMGKPYRYLNGKCMYTYEKIWTYTVGKFNVATVKLNTQHEVPI